MSATATAWLVQPLPAHGFEPHAAAWDALWRALPLRHPMLHAHFVQTLLRHFGNGRQWICALGSWTQPQALCIVQRGVHRGHWELFMPSQAEVGVALLHRIDDANTLLHALPGRAVCLDLLGTDPDVLPVDFAEDREIEIVPRTYTIGIRLEGAFEAYWAHRPKKLRENLRRHEGAARASLRDLRFRWIEEPEEMQAAIERYAQLETLSWKAQAGTAIDPGSEQHQFYNSLLSQTGAPDGPSTNGHSVVAELWAGDVLLASRLLWAAPDGEVVALKTTYSEAHRSIAPGRLLLRHVVEKAFERWPGRRLEFATDARADLEAWSDLQRHVRHISVYRHALARGSRNLAQMLARTLFPPSAPPVRGGPGELRAAVYRRAADLPASALALLAKAERRSLQLGHDWLQCLETQVYPDRDAPYYFVLAQGNEALAVWPVLSPDGNLLQRWTQPARSMANYYCAITGPVLQPWCKPIQLVVLLRFMSEQLRRSNLLDLQPMDPNDISTHTMRCALRIAGYGVFGYFRFVNWVHHTDGGWSRYLASRGGKTRSNIRRAVKKFTGAGGRTEIITNPSDVARGMSAYEQVYARSWKMAEPFPGFYVDLAGRTAQRQQLRLGLAWLGDQPIAAQYWTVAHGVAEIHKLAYDESHAELSAGTALSAVMFERVLDIDRVHTIDYLIGDDGYKRLWMGHKRQRWGWRAGRITHPLGLANVAAEGLKRVARALMERHQTRAQRPENSGTATVGMHTDGWATGR